MNLPAHVKTALERAVSDAVAVWGRSYNLDTDDITQTVHEAFWPLVGDYDGMPEPDQMNEFAIELRYSVSALMRQQVAQVSYATSGQARDLSRDRFGERAPEEDAKETLVRHTEDEVLSHLYDAISELPTTQRRICELKYVSGITSDELIGELLGMTRRDVARDRKRAERKIQKIFCV